LLSGSFTSPNADAFNRGQLPVAQPARVLIVDDHPPTVHACREALSNAGFDVFSAIELHDALDIAARKPPQVVLADAAFLWQRDYSTFARQFRKSGDSNRCPLVLLVPPRFSQDKLDVLRPFFDDSIFKPFFVAELVDIIARHAAPPKSYGTESTSQGLQGVCEAIVPWEARIGGTIAGCHIEKLLGRGSSGVVFLGRHLALDIQVAVKLIMLPEGRGRGEELRRFLRGAKAAACIQHPNVVQILNAGRENGQCFLVHRYIPGQSLKEVMASSRRKTEGRLLDVIAEIASALEAIHYSGEASGRAVLADFGLSRAAGLGDISGGSEIVGTPYYMSPEQCQSRPLDGRSDLYSLGVTAYHALSGHLPIHGDTPVQVLRGHIEQEPRALAEVVSGVSDETSGVVMRLLAKDPDKRFQSAGELLDCLQRIKVRS